MSNITYRRATRADAHLIVEFQIAMALETEELTLDLETCRRGVNAVFDNPALGEYFVAEFGGSVVGSTLITYEWSDWRDGMVWWIQSVYVAVEARRKGVYAGLYSYLQELTNASSEIRGIRLYVDLRNTSAQEVYTRLGMNGEHYRLFEWMKGEEKRREEKKTTEHTERRRKDTEKK
jgi:ribosomal protein S18 acetylase RimI-like enzyme